MRHAPVEREHRGDREGTDAVERGTYAPPPSGRADSTFPRDPPVTEVIHTPRDREPHGDRAPNASSCCLRAQPARAGECSSGSRCRRLVFAWPHQCGRSARAGGTTMRSWTSCRIAPRFPADRMAEPRCPRRVRERSPRPALAEPGCHDRGSDTPEDERDEDQRPRALRLPKELVDGFLEDVRRGLLDRRCHAYSERHRSVAVECGRAAGTRTRREACWRVPAHDAQITFVLVRSRCDVLSRVGEYAPRTPFAAESRCNASPGFGGGCRRGN